MKILKEISARKAAINIVVAGAVFYFLLSRVDLGDVTSAIADADPVLLLAAAAVYYVSIPLRGARWRRLLQNSGYEPGLGRTTGILFAAMFVNTVLPAKMGDVYRGYMSRKQLGTTMSRALGTIYAERLYDAGSLFLLSVATSYLVFGGQLPGELLKALGVGLVVIALLLTVAFLPVSAKRFGRLSGAVAEFRKGIRLSRGSMPTVLVLTGLVWAAESARLFLVAAALGISVSPSLAVFTALAGAFVTSMPLTPAGLGAVEGTITGVLLLAGFGWSDALTLALLDRAISYWSLMLTGGIYYVGVTSRG